MEITAVNLFYLFSMFIGSLVGLVLIYFGFQKNHHNILLGINFLFLTYISLIVWLITSGYYFHFPFLYRTGNVAGFLFMPLMYMYIRMVLTGRALTGKDLVHLLPLVVILVDFWPLFMLDNVEKQALIQSEISNPVLFTSYSQSRFFHFDFYTPFRSVVLAFYWILSAILVWTNTKKQDTKGFAKEWFIWIKIFLGLELLVFFPFLLLFWAIDPILNFLLVHLTVVLLTIVTGFALLFSPKILYGMDQNLFEEQSIKSKPERNETLSEQKTREIESKLEEVLDSEKKFLQHGYSIHSLAADTEIPVYLLTLYINHHLNTNFSDLINQKRIAESCKLIESGKYEHLSIIGLAEMSGFNNRNSYTLAFQKFKNVSPSAYIKSQRKKA
ncbi:helix-turn-helix domain-containing protein [Aquiflexum gelatinilyticum]|uniref:helix-turn-helix domain-containing protein n=1 Tax=Aquiflexum gelatinilyticum TaxID=2961943 RepID=UPI00216A05FE|nr:AraC family transcriptional regulator [Aquiflexum gelatinilyticum]MCS4436296.1 AraC family transcriptional regulator [Aquiflexum gelatinilyticum]